MVASTAQTAKGQFREEKVGEASYTGRHSLQMFEDGRSFSGNERFKLWFGRGDGTFEDFSALGGADANLDGRAVLATDFDDDGDVDLFVHTLQRERHVLYKNKLGDRGNHFLKVRLRATTGQYEAIGATVTVTATGRPPVAQVLSRGAGFVSCQAPELVFGLGAGDAATIDVLWPGGAKESFGSIGANARVLLTEGAGSPEAIEARSYALPDAVPDGLALRVGEVVPELALVDATGVPLTFDPKSLADGKPLYVNLWASYCVPCIAELPVLAKMHAAGDRRVAFVSVDAPSERATAAQGLAARAPGVPAFYLTDKGEGLEGVVDLLRLPIPTTLVLDAEGAVTEVIRGPVEEGQE